MEKADYLDLTGAQLQILLTIHRAGSLSLAARMLDMNQSTLSYWLAQLRERMGDPLFVRAGQGMRPTERMEGIVVPATDILHQLQSIAEPPGYIPEQDTGRLRIACSAIERDLLVHPLVREAAEVAPHLTFEITALGSGFQVAERLRDGQVDLALYPATLTAKEDLNQRVLFPVHDVVFFDPGHPLAAGDIEAYSTRPHARIAMGPDSEFDLDRRLSKAGRSRVVGLQVNDFDVLAQMVLGTPMIATLPLHMHHCSFCQLDWIEAPWPNDALDMAMYWHARHQGSQRHRHWRRKITALARSSAMR